MNFNQTDKVVELTHRLENFMDENVYPIEHEYEQFVRDSNNLWVVPPVVKTLKEKAKSEGLWNLFLPEEYADYSAGLSPIWNMHPWLKLWVALSSLAIYLIAMRLTQAIWKC